MGFWTERRLCGAFTTWRSRTVLYLRTWRGHNRGIARQRQSRLSRTGLAFRPGKARSRAHSKLASRADPREFLAASRLVHRLHVSHGSRVRSSWSFPSSPSGNRPLPRRKLPINRNPRAGLFQAHPLPQTPATRRDTNAEIFYWPLEEARAEPVWQIRQAAPQRGRPRWPRETIALHLHAHIPACRTASAPAPPPKQGTEGLRQSKQ